MPATYPKSRSLSSQDPVSLSEKMEQSISVTDIDSVVMKGHSGGSCAGIPVAVPIGKTLGVSLKMPDISEAVYYTPPGAEISPQKFRSESEGKVDSKESCGSDTDEHVKSHPKLIQDDPACQSHCIGEKLKWVSLQLTRSTGNVCGGDVTEKWKSAIPSHLKLEPLTSMAEVVEVVDDDDDGKENFRLVKMANRDIDTTKPCGLIQRIQRIAGSPSTSRNIQYLAKRLVLPILLLVTVVTPVNGGIIVFLYAFVCNSIDFFRSELKYSPKQRGGHGEKKAAHGRNSKVTFSHGGGDHAGFQGGGLGNVGSCDGSGGGDEDDNNRKEPEPGPKDQEIPVPLPHPTHGSFTDVSHAIHSVIANGQNAGKYLEEMMKCVACLLQGIGDCPSGFCDQLKLFISHYQDRSCHLEHGSCMACGLVPVLAKEHLKRTGKDLSLSDVIRRLPGDRLPTMEVEAPTNEAKPTYLGKDKEGKWSEVVDAECPTPKGFEQCENNVCIGGFLNDQIAPIETLGATSREVNFPNPEAYELTEAPGTTEEDLEDEVVMLEGLGIRSRFESAELGTPKEAVERSQRDPSAGPDSHDEDEEMLSQDAAGIEALALDEPRDSAEIKALASDELRDSAEIEALASDEPSDSAETDELAAATGGRAFVPEHVVMTATFSDNENIYDQFAKDEKPKLRRERDVRPHAASMPQGFFTRRRVIPPRPGSIGIGDRSDLVKISRRWEILKDAGYRQWTREMQAEPEGVFLEGDHIDEHAISINGSYQEGIHWNRTSANPIGEGCFGKVWKGNDATTHALFCIKEISLTSLEMPELTIWARLEHSGFCRLRGAIRCGQTVLIFMDYVGETLEEYLGRQIQPDLDGCRPHRLPLLRALQFLGEIMSSLFYLHQLGIVHNDFKSANILVDECTQKLKIIDFGMAMEIPRDRDGNPGTIRLQRPVGSEFILSPARCRSEAYGSPEDVWSGFAIFREMLTGYWMWFPQFQDAASLLFVIGFCSEPPLHLLPASLCLPSQVIELFRHGWQVASRPNAGYFLNLIQDIITGLQDGSIEYDPYLHPQGSLTEKEEGEEDDETATISALPQQSFRFEQNESDPEQMYIKLPTPQSPLEVSGITNKRETRNSPDQAMVEDYDGINLPAFQSVRDEKMVLAYSNTSSSVGPGNLPELSILQKANTSDSFSIPITQNDLPVPTVLGSSDLGSSVQQSMEIYVHREPCRTESMTSGFVSMQHTSSLQPVSEMTDESFRTVVAIPEEQEDQLDNNMVVPLSEVSSRSPSTPQSTDMQFDQKSKASSSSSDEMLARLQEEIEIKHLMSQASFEEDLENSYGSRSNEMSSASYRNEPSPSPGRLTDDVNAAFMLNKDPKGQSPVVVFHKEQYDLAQSQSDVIQVSLPPNTELQKIIEPAADRIHKSWNFHRFTVRDREYNILSLDERLDRLLLPGTSQLHLLVINAENMQEHSWIFEDGEARMGMSN